MSCYSPNIIIGIDGTICAFFIVYIIPFFLRYKTVNKKENERFYSLDINNDCYIVP